MKNKYNVTISVNLFSNEDKDYIHKHLDSLNLTKMLCTCDSYKGGICPLTGIRFNPFWNQFAITNNKNISIKKERHNG